MQIEPEIIYAAITAMAAAIVALWRKNARIWRKLIVSEERCREDMNYLWKKLAEVKIKGCDKGCSLKDLFEDWPDRREGTDRRKIVLPKVHCDRRSGEDRRTDIHHLSTDPPG